MQSIHAIPSPDSVINIVRVPEVNAIGKKPKYNIHTLEASHP